jgi:KRAB domain-containing zinc finger protein
VFSENGNLQTHMIMHTGVTPYTCKCDICGKGFSENGSEQTHIRIHTGDTTFTCIRCNTSMHYHVCL